MKDSALDLILSPDINKKCVLSIIFLRNILKEDKLNEFIKEKPIVEVLFMETIEKYKIFEREDLSKYIIEGNPGVVDKLINYIKYIDDGSIYKLSKIYTEWRKEHILKQRKLRQEEFDKLTTGIEPLYAILNELENIKKQANIINSGNDDPELLFMRISDIIHHAENATTMVKSAV